MINKIKFNQKPEHWVSWANQFYSHKKDYFTFIDPQVHMTEWCEDLCPDSVITLARTLMSSNSFPIIAIYMEDIIKFDKIVELSKIYNGKFAVLSENDDVLKSCKQFKVNHDFWTKPSRIPIQRYYEKWWDKEEERTKNFICISNASREEDNIVELIQAYFRHYIDQTEDGELVRGGGELNIYSAQELPIEPFNTIRFNGLQPNPIVFKDLKRSKLFLSPYNGPTASINIIDAIMIGVPVIIKDTKYNRKFFGLPNDSYYKDRKQLEIHIRRFRDMEMKEVNEIAKRNYITFKHRENVSIEGSFERLLEILNKI